MATNMINRDRYFLMKRAFTSLFPSHTVEICEVSIDSPLQFEVSIWSFRGDAYRASEFAGYITQASNLVKVLNDLELELNFTYDTKLNGFNSASYAKAGSEMKNALIEAMWGYPCSSSTFDKVKNILTDGNK